MLDIIATDHAPHSNEEKAKELKSAPSGMIGLETALALGITNLVRKGHITLPHLLKKMTMIPAGLYGLDCGYIKVKYTICRGQIVYTDEEEKNES